MDNLFILTETNKNSVCKGEILEISYFLYTRYDITDFSIITDIALDNFTIKDLYVAESLIFKRNKYKGILFNIMLLKKLTIFPIQSGIFEIESLQVGVNIKTQSKSFFELGTTKKYNIRSNTIKLYVHDLPISSTKLNINEKKQNLINNSIAMINGQIKNLPILEEQNIDEQQTLFNQPIDVSNKSEQLKLFDEIHEYPNIIDNFLFQCKRHLSELKSLLLDNKLLYFDVSNSVIDNAMNLIIHFANHNLDKTNIIYLLDEIAQFDMNGDTKIRFKNNMEAILSDYRTYLKSLKQLDVELKKIHKTKRVKSFVWISIITVIVVSILIFSNANKSEDSDYQITTKQTLTDKKINISPSLKKLNSNFENEKKVTTKSNETNLDQQIKKNENSANLDSNDDYLLTFNGKSYYLTKYHYDKAGELEPPKNEEADLTLKYNELERLENELNELGNNLDKFANKIDNTQVDKYSQTSIDNYNALTNRYNADIQIIKNKTSNYNSKLTKYESIRKIYNKKVDIYNSYLIKHGTLRKY